MLFIAYLMNTALISLISETPVVLVVISMVGRFLVIVAGNTTLQMGTEVVPTVIMGQSNSILTAFGNLLTLASSYIAHSVKILTTQVSCLYHNVLDARQ